MNSIFLMNTLQTRKNECKYGNSVKEVMVDSKWEQCAICKQDPMWMFDLKNDIDKARLYRNCQTCGKVVCTLCSPGGETLSIGAGILYSETKVKDQRIVAPHAGQLVPMIVCKPCYLHSIRDGR